MASRKTIKIVITVVVIFLGTYLASYVAARSSDAFEVARSFIVASPAAQKELGEIIDVGLSPFGYALEFSGSGGSADFECNVTGRATSGKVYIRLRKGRDGWKVIDARVHAFGREVPLL